MDLLVDDLPPKRLIEATAGAGRLLAEANADPVSADCVRHEVRNRALAEVILLYDD